MSVEVLIPLYTLSILPLVGISLAVKESIRKQHPEYGRERIEVAHIIDDFLGGNGSRRNLTPMTLPEHLVDHVVKAEEAEDWEVAGKQYGAARMIAGRMTDEERQKANDLLAQHKR